MQLQSATVTRLDCHHLEDRDPFFLSAVSTGPCKVRADSGHSVNIWKNKWRKMQTQSWASEFEFPSKQLTFPFHEVSYLAAFSSIWIFSSTASIFLPSVEEFYLLSKSHEEASVYTLHMAQMVFYFNRMWQYHLGLPNIIKNLIGRSLPGFLLFDKIHLTAINSAP
jgi:hypothetical protein